MKAELEEKLAKNMLILSQAEVDKHVEMLNFFYFVVNKEDPNITEKHACRNCKHLPIRSLNCKTCKGVYCEFCSQKLFTCINAECPDKNKVLATENRGDDFEGRQELFTWIQTHETVIKYIPKDLLI